MPLGSTHGWLTEACAILLLLVAAAAKPPVAAAEPPVAAKAAASRKRKRPSWKLPESDSDEDECTGPAPLSGQQPQSGAVRVSTQTSAHAADPYLQADSAHSDPQLAPSDPQSAPSDPQSAPSDPQSAPSDPQSAADQHRQTVQLLAEALLLPTESDDFRGMTVVILHELGGMVNAFEQEVLELCKLAQVNLEASLWW